MKVCIFGAGAIGAWLGAKLHASGVDVVLVARGPHLAAMRQSGLTVHEAGETQNYEVRATDDASSLGPFDYVIVTLKGHSIPAVAESIAALLHEDTNVLTAANGIPWWYFYGLDSPHADRSLESVDPGRVIWNSIGPNRAIGCVVYPSVNLAAPGVVNHVSDDRFCLGEPLGGSSERTEALAKFLIECGCRAPIRRDIRNELWMKLWGNVAFNPISVLTGGNLDDLATDDGTRNVAALIMQEVKSVGEKYGIRFRLSIDRRIDGARAVGAHKTSMLQDYELGRELECGTIVEAVQELGRIVNVATPTIDLVYSLLKQKVSNRDRAE